MGWCSGSSWSSASDTTIVDEVISEKGGSRLDPELEAVDMKEGKPIATVIDGVRDDPEGVWWPEEGCRECMTAHVLKLLCTV